MEFYSIAIDGPAGAGKSTIAREIAENLDYIYVDTGAMYRAYGLYCILNNIEDFDEVASEELIKEVNIDIRFINREQRIFLNEVDVTKKIRTEEVGNMASKISKSRCLRDALVDKQREIAHSNNIVMDGRDIGSNVLKDATLKIYLTASVDVRAKRRWNEYQEKGIDRDFHIIREEIIRRDYRDMNREYAPLIKADDAVLVDTSDLTINRVKDTIVGIFRKRV